MTEADDTTPERSRKRWFKWVVLGGIGVVVLFFAGIFVYANFINDSPDALDETDLSNALTTAEAPTNSADFDGDWIPTTASEFG